MSVIKRNLVVGLDGTWNDGFYKPSEETESAHPTNVVRLINACQYRRDQVKHYERGVGTDVGEIVSGGLWGEDLDGQILDAYRFIRKSTQENEFNFDNRLFLFGFSRGAYAARRLCAFLSECGITKNAEDDQRLWKAYSERDHETIESFKRDNRVLDATIDFIGVWDTVKSTNDPDFDDYDLPDQVKAARHAIALDERRGKFDVLRFNVDPRLTQTWFSGVHGDVGGGYEQCGQADITLRWMLDAAAQHGLLVKPESMGELHADSCTPLNESYIGKWTYLDEHQRIVPQEDEVHQSVKERCEREENYNPPNFLSRR